MRKMRKKGTIRSRRRRLNVTITKKGNVNVESVIVRFVQGYQCSDRRVTQRVCSTHLKDDCTRRIANHSSMSKNEALARYKSNHEVLQKDCNHHPRPPRRCAHALFSTSTLSSLSSGVSGSESGPNCSMTLAICASLKGRPCFFSILLMCASFVPRFVLPALLDTFVASRAVGLSTTKASVIPPLMQSSTTALLVLKRLQIFDILISTLDRVVSISLTRTVRLW
jgi:hypothetical protein